MNAAAAILGVGPRGGDINNPIYRPEARNAHLNAAKDPVTGLPALHKGKPFSDSTAIGRIDEAPWARMAAFMLLAGRTNSEIGVSAGVHPDTVRNLRAQRWFQELLSTLANEQGEDVLGLINSEAIASIEKIVAIRDNAENDKTALAASIWLAEQKTGKAIQKILTASTSRSFASVEDEERALLEELEALRSARQSKPTPTTIDVEASPVPSP